MREPDKEAIKRQKLLLDIGNHTCLCSTWLIPIYSAGWRYTMRRNVKMLKFSGIAYHRAFRSHGWEAVKLLGQERPKNQAICMH